MPHRILVLLIGYQNPHGEPIIPRSSLNMHTVSGEKKVACRVHTIISYKQNGRGVVLLRREVKTSRVPADNTHSLAGGRGGSPNRVEK